MLKADAYRCLPSPFGSWRNEALAEGCGRATDKDFAHYVSMASGSASEVENQIQRAFDLLLIVEAEYASLTADIVEIRKMLYGLHKRLRGG